MKKAESMHAITKAFTSLYNIDDAEGLKRERLTLADYRAACETMEQLRQPGASASTIIKTVADFFGRCGYEVKPEGIAYKISC